MSSGTPEGSFRKYWQSYATAIATTIAATMAFGTLWAALEFPVPATQAYCRARAGEIEAQLREEIEQLRQADVGLESTLRVVVRNSQERQNTLNELLAAVRLNRRLIEDLNASRHPEDRP